MELKDIVSICILAFGSLTLTFGPGLIYQYYIRPQQERIKENSPALQSLYENYSKLVSMYYDNTIWFVQYFTTDEVIEYGRIMGLRDAPGYYDRGAESFAKLHMRVGNYLENTKKNFENAVKDMQKQVRLAPLDAKSRDKAIKAINKLEQAFILLNKRNKKIVFGDQSDEIPEIENDFILTEKKAIDEIIAAGLIIERKYKNKLQIKSKELLSPPDHYKEIPKTSDYPLRPAPETNPSIDISYDPRKRHYSLK